MDNTIFSMIDKYRELLDEKAELDVKIKANNNEIKEMKKQLSQIMIDNECPKISRNGFVYSLQTKTRYSKKSAEALMEKGVDFFEVLRQEGLGDLITETVNATSLSASLNNYIDENGELSEELNSVVNVYEYYDIGKRKETNKTIK